MPHPRELFGLDAAPRLALCRCFRDHAVMPATFTRPFALLAVPVVLLSAACGSRVPSPEDRTFREMEGRFTYVVPPHWVVWMGEARSPKGSLFSVEIVPLQDSMPEFVAGMPDTMLPLLREQTGRFFSVVGPGDQRDVTVGGVTMRELVLPVRVRAGDPESRVVFWTARYGMNAFVLRVSYPAGLMEQDAPAVAEIIASWKFAPLPTPDPDTTKGRIVPRVPAQ